MLTDAELLNDPNTDIYVLTDIASRSPQLWPMIAVHPNCSPELAEWIKQMLAQQGVATVATQSEPVDSTPGFNTPMNPAPTTSGSKKILIVGISFSVLIILASIITIAWILLMGKPTLNHPAGNANTATAESGSPEHATSEAVKTTEGVSTDKPSEETKSPKVPEKKAITPHSHPLAGGPRPPQAKAPTNVINYNDTDFQIAPIVTPDRNIGCDIMHSPNEVKGDHNFLDCKVESWMKHAPVEPKDTDPRYYELAHITMEAKTGKPVFGGDKHDGFCFIEGYCGEGTTPQVLNYGEMIYFADFVCASEQEGLSCWSVKSGHGALMSRNHFETY